MQIISKLKQGYVTIYISLVFTIILSLLLVLVEGTQIGATRLQAKMVAELSMDSCMAEYSRSLWKNYHQLFIDTAYGENKGSEYRLQRHLQNYIDKNRKQDVFFTTNFLKLKNPYLEIENVKYATDDYGKVWKQEAVNYMKDTYGISALEGLIDNVTSSMDFSEDAFSFNVKNFGDQRNMDIKTITKRKEEELQAKLDREREERIAAKKAGYGKNLTEEISKEIEDSEPREIVNLHDKRDAGISMQELVDNWDNLRGKGILSLVIPGENISDKKLERDKLLTSTIEMGDNSLSMQDEAIFNEYLFNHFGNYKEILSDKKLDYEMEYIISGHLSDEDNLRAFADKVLMLRLGANYMYLSGDGAKQGELTTMASLMAAAILAPESEPVFKILLQSSWCFAESVNDVRRVFEGESVPLVKTSSDWQIGLQNAIRGVTKAETSSTSVGGLDYKGYLRLFLYLTGKDIAPRSMDLVEQNLGIKMTNCVYEFCASFGFEDVNGHNYLFSKKRNYE